MSYVNYSAHCYILKNNFNGRHFEDNVICTVRLYLIEKMNTILSDGIFVFFFSSTTAGMFNIMPK